MTKIGPALVLLAVAAPASTPISTGTWELSNQLEEVLFNGIRDNAATPPSKPQSVCLSKEDAAKGPGLAFSDISICRVTKSSLQDGKFQFQTECEATESSDIITTSAAGNYTPTSYTGESISIQRRGDMKIEMRSRMEAKRLGDC